MGICHPINIDMEACGCDCLKLFLLQYSFFPQNSIVHSYFLSFTPPNVYIYGTMFELQDTWSCLKTKCAAIKGKSHNLLFLLSLTVCLIMSDCQNISAPWKFRIRILSNCKTIYNLLLLFITSVSM